MAKVSIGIGASAPHGCQRGSGTALGMDNGAFDIGVSVETPPGCVNKIRGRTDSSGKDRSAGRLIVPCFLVHQDRKAWRGI
jgi:hypothetical protein